MILGFSDAYIGVVKRGDGLREQGQLCIDLGWDVAPRVLRLHEDGYEMELLERPENLDLRDLKWVFQTLSDHVWSRDCREDPSGWLGLLLCWAGAFPWILPRIRYCYPTEPTDGYTMIHGDPTLANLMRRGSKSIITDPMPRLYYRREIPERPEVDLGKLVQTCCGWEHVLGAKTSINDQHIHFIAGLKPEIRAKAALWGAIHLARVGKRAAQVRKRPDVAVWAFERSKDLAQLVGCRYA